MKLLITHELWFSKEDYVFIKNQLKEKHLKWKDVMRESSMSRQYIHMILNGQVKAPKELVSALLRLGIKLPFTELIYEKGIENICKQ